MSNTLAKDLIVIRHGSVVKGPAFFSCCSVRLGYILSHIIDYKKLPKIVDCKNTFTMYKTTDEDITFKYFEHYNNLDDITFDEKTIEALKNMQHSKHYWSAGADVYKYINFKLVCPIIKKYFTPSQQIMKYLNDLVVKYKVDYNNTCCVFFRGLDKFTETKLCGYSEYDLYINQIIAKNPNIKLLIQSDETEFIEYVKQKYPDNSFYFKDEIRHVKKSRTLVEKHFGNNDYYQMNFLSIVLLMSKCNYIICNGGTNVSFWIILFRGHCKNVIQYLNGGWY
jgi:hypothetical protein